MRKIALFLLGLAALLASSGRIFAAGEGPGKWDESSAGRWGSLPERHVGATDNGISVEVTMSPGTGVLYRRVGRWRDYLYGERVYMLLSLFAKSALAWQVFAGTLQPA